MFCINSLLQLQPASVFSFHVLKETDVIQVHMIKDTNFAIMCTRSTNTAECANCSQYQQLLHSQLSLWSQTTIHINKL